MKNSHFKSLILLTSATILLGAGCASNTQPPKTTPDTTIPAAATVTTPETATKTITTPPLTTPTPKTPVATPEPVKIVYNMAEVAKHNNANDCWQVIDGSIYNVTSYIPYHPAGPDAIIFCGKDSSGIFNMKHSPDKKQQLTPYFVSNLQ